MDITRAEFQFDGKKLTFYYMAAAYVDFRDLVRALFRVFGTRIWMVWYKRGDPDTQA
jgi:cell fate regulator YaaT (PSP1 superfamily)